MAQPPILLFAVGSLPLPDLAEEPLPLPVEMPESFGPVLMLGPFLDPLLPPELPFVARLSFGCPPLLLEFPFAARLDPPMTMPAPSIRSLPLVLLHVRNLMIVLPLIANGPLQPPYLVLFLNSQCKRPNARLALLPVNLSAIAIDLRELLAESSPMAGLEQTVPMMPPMLIPAALDLPLQMLVHPNRHLLPAVMSHPLLEILS